MNQFSQPDYKFHINSNNYCRLHQVRISITPRKSLNTSLFFFFFQQKGPKHWFVFLNEARFSQIFWYSPKIVRDWFVFQRKSPKWVHFVPKWPWKLGGSFKAWVTQTLTSPNQILWKLQLCGNLYLFSTILMNIMFSLWGQNKTKPKSPYAKMFKMIFLAYSFCEGYPRSLHNTCLMGPSLRIFCPYWDGTERVTSGLRLSVQTAHWKI